MTRAGGLAPILLLPVLFSAGCGEHELAKAAKNAESRSMRLESTFAGSAEEGSFETHFDGLSSADGANGRYTGTTDLNAELLHVEVVEAAGSIWMRAEEWSAVMPPGRRWVRLEDAVNQPRLLRAPHISRLLSRAGDVERVSADEVMGGGIHYKGSISADAVVDALGEGGVPFQLLADDGDTEFPIDVWIAERTRLPVRVKLSARGRGGSLELTADIHRYDVPVRVKAPPVRTTMGDTAFVQRLRAGCTRRDRRDECRIGD